MAIGFCLMAAIVLLILFYVGGDSRQNLEQLHRSKIQEEVLAKINDYKAKNGKIHTPSLKLVLNRPFVPILVMIWYFI